MTCGTGLATGPNPIAWNGKETLQSQFVQLPVRTLARAFGGFRRIGTIGLDAELDDHNPPVLDRRRPSWSYAQIGHFDRRSHRRAGGRGVRTGDREDHDVSSLRFRTYENNDRDF